MDEFYRRKIEVRGHRLLIYFNQAVNVQHEFFHFGRKGGELRVFQACCGKWGLQFGVRAGGKYYTFEACPVCHQRKTEVFLYDEIRPLLPAEWWQPEGRMS